MTKIVFQFQFLWIAAISFSTSHAQSLNKYGLVLIKHTEAYLATVRADSNRQMADLSQFIPGIAFDLRYATTDNFLNKKLYPRISTTYMRLPAAKALQKAQQELAGLGLGLKIFDAYRPYTITLQMWEPIKDDRYVADPKKGSGHNRGTAVDLTIIQLDTGKEIDMGTGFDNFSDTAHHSFKGLSPAVLHNRQLLKTLMEKYGFVSLETEWWHYSLPNAREYELLDLDFKKLQKVQRKKN